MNRIVLIVGIGITLALVAILSVGLGTDPSEIRSPLVGQPAPQFSLQSLGSTQSVDLRGFLGKPVVVNFWATWCRPCYHEHPILVENARVIGSRVQFLGVVFNDTEDNINAFLRERGSAYPTLIDQHGKTAIEYGVGGVPETFFINARGQIVAKFSGPLTTEALHENLAKVMQ